MSVEELKFVGLTAEAPKGLLDTDEKVRQLKEQLAAAQEETAKRWEAAKRDSRQEAMRCFVS